MKAYLDNNATTPLDPRVLDAMITVLKEDFGNPASATHAWGWKAEAHLEIARKRVAESIHCLPEEIIFTSGATESSNTALRYSSKNKLAVITSAIEHKATLDPLATLAADHTQLEVDEYGFINFCQLEEALQKSQSLVSIIAAHNEIGTIQKCDIISQMCKSNAALLHLDIAQVLGKTVIDLSDVHMASLSAHKVYGPKGVGALYIRKDVQSELVPLLFGGGHERNLRSGTVNISGIVGFGMAAQLASSEQTQIHKKISSLTTLFLELLKGKVPELKLNGPKENRLLGNLHITIDGLNASKLLSKLANSVALSSTSACTSAVKEGSHVLKAIGLDKQQIRSSFRVGIGRFNTEDEIRFAAERISALAPDP